MAETSIEWAHYTFNAWRGCTKVSAGCANCYADTLSKRNPGTLGIWGPKGTRAIAAESYWTQLARWQAEAKAAGERRRVFCASLADVGEGQDTMPPEAWEPVQQARRRLCMEIMDRSDALDFLLLTKRPGNMVDLYPREVLERCWVGTSVEDQKAADERIPKLLQVPAAVRFLSCEPLLGPVDLWGARYARPNGGTIGAVTHWEGGVDWVIVGGESGPGARPMHPDWVRQLRAECQAADVPFLFKQWGEHCPAGQVVAVPREHKPSQAHVFPDGRLTIRVGKKAAGRLLDGREWNELPKAAVLT